MWNEMYWIGLSISCGSPVLLWRYGLYYKMWVVLLNKSSVRGFAICSSPWSLVQPGTSQQHGSLPAQNGGKQLRETSNERTCWADSAVDAQIPITNSQTSLNVPLPTFSWFGGESSKPFSAEPDIKPLLLTGTCHVPSPRQRRQRCRLLRCVVSHFIRARDGKTSFLFPTNVRVRGWVQLLELENDGEPPAHESKVIHM